MKSAVGRQPVEQGGTVPWGHELLLRLAAVQAVQRRQAARRVSACHTAGVPGEPRHARGARGDGDQPAGVVVRPATQRPAPPARRRRAARHLDRGTRARRHHRAADDRADRRAAGGPAGVARAGARDRGAGARRGGAAGRGPHRGGEEGALGAVSPAAEAVLARLRPFPDDGGRADGPVAVDATDRLLLDEAAALLGGGRAVDAGDGADTDARFDPAEAAGAAEAAGPAPEHDRAVILGDRFGALTIGALALGARHVDVHTDALTAEAALDANSDLVSGPLREAHGAGTFGYTVHDDLSAELVRGARLVLLQLPKSLAELTEVAELVAREADPEVILLAGGRVKHMTHAMNDVLAASFGQVSASLARQKSRLLVARGPRADIGAPSYPVTARLTDPEIVRAATPVGSDAREDADRPTGLTVVAHGAVFAGAALDQGTRFLLAQADRWPAP